MSKKSREAAIQAVEEAAAYFVGTEIQPKKKEKRCFSIFEFTTTYPEENPETALQDITKALAYIGLFDGMKQNKAK